MSSYGKTQDDEIAECGDRMDYEEGGEGVSCTGRKVEFGIFGGRKRIVLCMSAFGE